jgi:hypothetical protein
MNVVRHGALSFCVAAVLLAMPGLVGAGQGPSATGIVVDESGGAIVGARITVRDASGVTVRTARRRDARLQPGVLRHQQTLVAAQYRTC